MPWRKSSLMSLRSEFIHLVQSGSIPFRTICNRFGISAKTGYKWLHRYRAEGIKGLLDRSRRPINSPNRTPSEKESSILQIRKAHPVWGARKLHARYNTISHDSAPAVSTIHGILKRNGCINPDLAAKHTAWNRFEAPEPNALWQMDFKGHFQTDTGACYPLTLLDDHSRFNIGLVACSNETRETVQRHLVSIFRQYGIPVALLVDNGPPWGAPKRDSYSTLAAWLMRTGIKLIRARPYHPQTVGKDERFHRTLKTELINYNRFKSIQDCQLKFNEWRSMYNCERPHQAIDMMTPITRYKPAAREFPEDLPPIEYAPDDHVRKVQGKGEISFKGRIFTVGKAFKGYPVALRPTNNDGEYNVYFCSNKIANINMKNYIKKP